MKIPIVILLIALLVGSLLVANASNFMERQDRLCRPSQAPGTLQDNSIVTPSNCRMECCESHVCPGRCQYSSIQKAIDAAKPGDTICVAAGTYYENIFIPKSVNILGSGIDQTSIDGSDKARVFNVGRDRTGTIYPDVCVTISDMTIKNGRAEDNFLPSNHPDGNPNHRLGGGILNAGTLTLENCLITNNIAEASAAEGGGGGIMNYGKKLTLKRCVLSNNEALGFGNAYGGAIMNWHDSGEMLPKLKVSDSVINNNVAKAGTTKDFYSYGGGIWNRGTCEVIEKSVITSNEARFGGGIESYDNLRVCGSSIHHNLAKENGNGGGIANWGTGTQNCIVKDSDVMYNTADNYGGGIYNNGTLSVEKSEILENSASNGGGIAFTLGHAPTISRTIIHSNTPNDNVIV